MIPDDVRTALLDQAREATKAAYAPYSGIRVGAAVLLPGDLIVTGANIENAAQSLNCCAERVAIYAAIARHGVARVRALAVSMLDAGQGVIGGPASPCGPCRQVMSEFMDADAPVIVDGWRDYSVRDLLPDAFRRVRPGGG